MCSHRESDLDVCRCGFEKISHRIARSATLLGELTVKIFGKENRNIQTETGIDVIISMPVLFYFEQGSPTRCLHSTCSLIQPKGLFDAVGNLVGNSTNEKFYFNEERGVLVGALAPKNKAGRTLGAWAYFGVIEIRVGSDVIQKNISIGIKSK